MLEQSRSWPGRLAASEVDAVRRAQARLSKARTKHLTATVAAALDICDALLAGSGRDWAPPPVPLALLACAASDMIGVPDHPFYACGQRPRTSVDEAAARVASAATLSNLWTRWSGEVRRVGLHDGADLVPQQGRPAAVAALGALTRAWFDMATALCASGGLRVVALTSRQSGGSVGPIQAAATALTAMAALKIPDRDDYLAVVPAVVADWLSRADLRTFEDIGPWPGDEHGVAILETLVDLAGGDPYRMAALLPAAADLVTEQHR